jgi:colicin import membrane protein
MRPARPKQWGPGAMARKLKTYTTSAGFFDLAIAAPSMKAALEAWGSRINLFHQGFARESDDPATVAATMARPGVVLRRAVGSNGKFSEDAELPTDLPTGKAIAKAREKPAEPAPKRPAAKKREPAPRPPDDKAARQAALAFEKERKRRETRRRSEEDARRKEGERRDRAIAAAQAALEEAEQDHRMKAEQIDKDRAAVDRRAQAEEDRWKKAKERLDDALRRSRTARYLRPV